MRRLAAAAAAALVAAGCGSEARERPAAPAFTTEIDNPYWPIEPGTRWVSRRRGRPARRRHRHPPDEEGRHRHRRPRRARHRDRARAGRRGHLRLVRAGRARQRLVPRRGHDRVRGRQAGVDGGLARRRASTAPRPGSSCPPIRAPGMGYRQEHYPGHAEDAGPRPQPRRAGRGAVRPLHGRADDARVEPARAEGARVQVLRAGVGPVLALGVSGGSDREELLPQ